MTLSEAIRNIGKPFKYSLCHQWDIITTVQISDSMIVGDIITAPIEDCRLKQEQPEALKKYLQNKK